jgi:hypothetical protein
MTLHHRAEPFALHWYWLMPSAHDLFSHFFEFSLEALSDCLAANGKTVVSSGASTYVREP